MAANTLRLEHLNPKELLSFDGLSQVVRVQRGTTVYLAGQAPFNPSFELLGGDDFKAQATATLKNVAAAVNAAGGSPADVVSSTVYIKGLSGARSSQFFEAMAQALDGLPFPAHAFSIIGVAELGAPEQLIEISAIAVIQA
ncbi:MAG: RidA family protein [Comamonas sp.]|nr:RidA family protein [Comamonas sp.]